MVAAAAAVVTMAEVTAVVCATMRVYELVIGLESVEIRRIGAFKFKNEPTLTENLPHCNHEASSTNISPGNTAWLRRDLYEFKFTFYFNFNFNFNFRFK